MEPPTGQQDLNDALLEQIFAFVCVVEQPRGRSQGLPAYRPNRYGAETLVTNSIHPPHSGDKYLPACVQLGDCSPANL